LAVIQTHAPGYHVASAVPGSGKFTIYLNKAAASNIYVAYFVIN
jgi:hypothetical protein